MKAARARPRGLRLAASAVAVLVLTADQVSKSLVVAARPGGHRRAGLVTLPPYGQGPASSFPSLFRQPRRLLTFTWASGVRDRTAS